MLNRNDHPICGLLLLDIFEYLKGKSITNKGFNIIGEMLSQKQVGRIENKLPSTYVTPKLFWETVIEIGFRHVEQNLLYRIHKISNERIVIKSQTREETKHGLNLSRFGNNEHYQNILGYYIGVTRHFFRLDPQVKDPIIKHSKSDDEVFFEIEYGKFSRIFNRQETIL